MTTSVAVKIRDRAGGQLFGAHAGPFMAPALAILCVINVLPFLWSIGISFFRFRADRLNTPPKFLWFGNYLDLIDDPDVWEHFTNTGVMIASSVLIQLVVGALLAFLFYRPFPGRRLVLMLVLTPMLLSTVAVGTFFSLFYDPTFGIVSALVRPFTGAAFAPLGTPLSAVTSLVVADAWMWSPFVMMLLLAGLDGVPPYLLEAAEIDRASPGSASGQSLSRPSAASCYSRSCSGRSSSSTCSISFTRSPTAGQAYRRRAYQPKSTIGRSSFSRQDEPRPWAT